MILNISDVQRDSVAIVQAIWRVHKATHEIGVNGGISEELANEVRSASEVASGLLRPYLVSAPATELLVSSIVCSLLMNLDDAFNVIGEDLEQRLDQWVLNLAGGEV